jgi:hypothetical protein
MLPNVTSSQHRPGDKVRLNAKAQTPGLRGIVTEAETHFVIIKNTKDGSPLRVLPEHLTNFSLAARKAWKKMPERRVGRPRGSRVCDRISVTIRFDRELWQRFRAAETRGLVTDRTATFNTWLEEHLDRVQLKDKKIAS